MNLYGLLEEGKGDQQFVLNADDSLSPMQSPDFVWGGNLQPLEKLGWIRSQPFVIRQANWPAEVTPSSCQASELEGGMSPLTEGIYSVECPNANLTPAKVVLKRYVDNNLRTRRMVAAANVFSQVGASPTIIASLITGLSSHSWVRSQNLVLRL